jgi:hypothetical protein
MLPAQGFEAVLGDKETPNMHQSEISHFLPLLPEQINVESGMKCPLNRPDNVRPLNDFLLVFLLPKAPKRLTKEVTKCRNLIESHSFMF